MKNLAVLILFSMGAGQEASFAKDPEWNQWRGPNRDGHSPDTGLLKEWPEEGPPLAWKTTKIGAGYSSVSFVKDRIFTMGDVEDGCALIALDPADGKTLWTAKVGEPGGGGGYPGPRCTPATDGKLVFALGQFGDLICVEVGSGKERWRKHLQQDFGGKVMSGWGYAESPLLDGDHLICTPGGSKGTVLALKKEDGEPVWRSEDFRDPASYASLVPAEIGGVRQYIVLTDRRVAGVEAKSGKLLWKARRAGRTAVAATPIIHDGFVFVSSGYGVGCNGFKVSASDGAFTVEEVYSGKQLQIHHGGVIRVGNHVYGLDDRQGLKCIELKTGNEVWRERSVGKGSITYADGHFFAWGERGKVALVEATPEGYKEKGRFDPPEARNQGAFAHPTVFGGKLYIRDQSVLLCYDVKAKK
ncbi:MAG: PQQ-like beta-propeller repeat protein [Planctomycetes bacterium]|nr:PQQ-like beta-propeller repeat protein [Planctomycetota bacterium]